MCDCKSVLYTALTTGTAVTNGGVIPLGNTVRRKNCAIKQNGNSIVVCGEDVFFKVTVVATFAAESTAPITLQLLQDGVPVIGATSTITVAGTSDETVLPLTAVVRNECDCSSSLSFTVSGADVTVDNFSVTVEEAKEGQMRIIGELSKQIRGEVEGVCEYAKFAVDHKKTDPVLAETYFKIANVEMTHVRLLHEQVMRKIAEAEKSGIEYPQFMRDKWEDQHKEIISKMAEAKVYLGLYK